MSDRRPHRSNLAFERSRPGWPGPSAQDGPNADRARHEAGRKIDRAGREGSGNKPLGGIAPGARPGRAWTPGQAAPSGARTPSEQSERPRGGRQRRASERPARGRGRPGRAGRLRRPGEPGTATEERRNRERGRKPRSNFRGHARHHQRGTPRRKQAGRHRAVRRRDARLFLFPQRGALPTCGHFCLWTLVHCQPIATARVTSRVEPYF